VLLFLEYDIRKSGWKPSVVDSGQLWAQQRKRATDLRDRAIILVGTSRIQLGMDLGIVKQVSKLEPVQLAIDGSPFMPVLQDLASDPDVTGTVVISVKSNIRFDEQSRSFSWVKSYQDSNKTTKVPYQVFNDVMKMFFENNMVTRLEGAKPFTVISSLAFKGSSFGNYLITHQNRSREADYNKVKMPHFYLNRVQRHYGNNLVQGKVSIAEFLSIYDAAISNIKPVDNREFIDDIDYFMSLIQKIEERGGKVVIVRFPTSKVLWMIDKKRYPRNMFWDELEKRHHRAIHFSDYPSLSKFNLPDGSHLDYRDKKEFTESLMRIIRIKV
jgi:ribosomal protein L24E